MGATSEGPSASQQIGATNQSGSEVSAPQDLPDSKTTTDANTVTTPNNSGTILSRGTNVSSQLLVKSKESMPVTALAVAHSSIDPNAILSRRTPTSIWSLENAGSPNARAIDLASGRETPGAFNPCKSLPKLSVNYSALLLPAGELVCWSIDSSNVIIVKHLREDDSEHTSAFEVTNLQWALLGRALSESEFSEFRILGVSASNLYLASKNEFLSLDLNAGSLSLTRVALKALGLASQPQSGLLKNTIGLRSITLSMGRTIYSGQETAPSSSIFQWSHNETQIDASPDLNLATNSETLAQAQFRFVSETAERFGSAQSEFMIHGTKLYSVRFGELKDDPPAPTQWAGLPFLTQHCSSCHSSAQGSLGGLRLVIDGQPNFSVLKDKAAVIIERVKLSRPNVLAMPPYAPLPANSEIEVFESALKGL
jgi:hypothetical protein